MVHQVKLVIFSLNIVDYSRPLETNQGFELGWNGSGLVPRVWTKGLGLELDNLVGPLHSTPTVHSRADKKQINFMEWL